MITFPINTFTAGATGISSLQLDGEASSNTYTIPTSSKLRIIDMWFVKGDIIADMGDTITAYNLDVPVAQIEVIEPANKVSRCTTNMLYGANSDACVIPANGEITIIAQSGTDARGTLFLLVEFLGA